MTISEEIIIIGRNEAKQVFEELGRDAKKATGDVGKGATEASGGLKDMGKSANELVQGLTGMNIASLAGVGGIIALADGVKIAVSETMDYEDEIRRLSLLTGQNLVVTTQMDSLFNRFGITGGQLNMVMRTLSKEGIDPNIASIEKLSAEFQKLETPAERDAFLIKNFGRAGLDLGIMLSQGPAQLQAYAAATNSMLVPTQKQMEAELKLKMATFDLGEAVKAFKIEIGNEFIPAVLDAVNAVNYLIGAMDPDTKATYKNVLERQKLEHLYRNHAISAYHYGASVEELVRREEAATLAALGLGTAITTTSDVMVGRWSAGMSETRPYILDFNRDLADETKALDELQKAADKAAKDGMEVLKMSMGGGLGAEMESFTKKQDDIGQKIEETRKKIEDLQKANPLFYGVQDEYHKLMGDLQDLGQKYDDNATAHKKATDKILYDILDMKLAQSGLSDEVQFNIKSKYATAMGLVDDATMGANNAMGMLLKTAQDTGTVANLAKAWETYTADMDMGLGKTQAMKDAIAALTDKTVTVTVVVKGDPFGSAIPQREAGGSTDESKHRGKRAEGGPVSAGQAYLVGERGPEVFVPHNSGTIVPNKGGSLGAVGGVTIQELNVYVNGAGDPKRVAQEVIAEISNQVRAARRGGSGMFGG